jgi:hypothetical protein
MGEPYFDGSIEIVSSSAELLAPLLPEVDFLFPRDFLAPESPLNVLPSKTGGGFPGVNAVGVITVGA